VRLAFVLDKRISPDNKEYYEAVTILPVEWAYMNSRLIVRPDDEWARLIDETEEEENNCETFDNEIDTSNQD